MLGLALVVSLIISWIDIRSRVVPIRVLQLGGGAALVLQALQGNGVHAIIAGVIGFGLFFLPSFLSKGKWLGEGDAWVGAWMGVALGLPLLWVGLYLSILLGGAVAGVLLCFGWTRKDRVPLAPILSAGLLLTLAWGHILLAWVRAFLYTV
jgi:prepilin signal peptidase PulO-like enzyme (type II secretory pathway)